MFGILKTLSVCVRSQPPVIAAGRRNTETLRKKKYPPYSLFRHTKRGFLSVCQWWPDVLCRKEKKSRCVYGSCDWAGGLKVGCHTKGLHRSQNRPIRKPTQTWHAWFYIKKKNEMPDPKWTRGQSHPIPIRPDSKCGGPKRTNGAPQINKQPQSKKAVSV